jgi:uncharacterized protein with HEPN domain
MPHRDWKLRIKDIVDAINVIQGYTEGEPFIDLCFLKLHYLERDVEFFIYFNRI